MKKEDYEEGKGLKRGAPEVIMRSCDWEQSFHPNAIGREIERDLPFGDSARRVVYTAFVESFKEAAADLMEQVVRKYNSFDCEQPCRKYWYPDYWGDEGGPFSITNVNVTPPLASDSTAPTTYMVSVTLRGNFVFGCDRVSYQDFAPPDQWSLEPLSTYLESAWPKPD